MSIEIRELEASDRPAQWELARLAFGIGPEHREAWLLDRPARRYWGVFEGGRLVASAIDLAQGHWFGGRVVPASGVGAVVVAPELRRAGLGRRLLTALLGAAQERGAATSTLFPTTPQVYRALGYEVVGALTWTAVPTAALAGLRAPDGISLRPAVEGDVPTIVDAYRAAARESAGMLDRVPPRVDPDALLGRYDGVTVAVDRAGEVQGYAAWDRRGGYGADGAIAVADLFTHTAPAAEALLAMLGSWAAVAPTLKLRLAPADPIRLIAPLTGARIESIEPWMLRILDAPRAIAARGWPPHLLGEIDVAFDDGPWRLGFEHGLARLEPGGGGGTRLAARGFAALYAGAATPAMLRRAGLMSGGDSEMDALLEAAFAGPPPALLDYF